MNYYDPMYCGSESLYRVNAMMPRLVCTKSVVDTCKSKGMYWTLDVIVSHVMTNKKCRGEGFMVAFFDVKDNQCSFKLTDGNDHVLCRQKIEYTDAPVSVKYFLVDDGENIVLMYPSDY